MLGSIRFREYIDREGFSLPRARLKLISVVSDASILRVRDFCSTVRGVTEAALPDAWGQTFLGGFKDDEVSVMTRT